MLRVLFMFWQKNKTKEKRRRKKRRRKHKSSLDQTLEKFVVEEIELGAVPGADLHVGPGANRSHKLRPRSRWFMRFRFTLGWMSLWLVIVASGVLSRNIWPADETRFLALAWDLFQRDVWLLPHLNGEPYFSQPPLGLWLVVASWQFAGFSDWWPRFLPGLAGLFSLVVTVTLTRRLWPDQRDVILYVPLFLLGSSLWAMYLTLTLSDLLVVSFTALTILFAHQALYGNRLTALLLGPAMALALLAGGPVALVYSVPVLLLAPAWATQERDHTWVVWYGILILSVVFAVGAWVAWAVAAGQLQGLNWQQAINAASQMQSLLLFYTSGAWWWYLFLIPLVFFPWSVWPLGWMRLWHVRSEKLDSGIVMCMIWGIPAILLLSLLPVRQPQLLLPLFPAYAMVLVRLLLHDELRAKGENSFFAGMTFPVIVIGGMLAILPGLPRVPYMPEFLWEMSPFIGVAVAVLGIALSWAPSMDTGKRIGSIAVTTMLVVVASNIIIGYQFSDHYESIDLNVFLYEAEQEGKAIAQVGSYHGELHYTARLTRPLTVLNKDNLLFWAAKNPDGIILTYSNRWQPANYNNMTPLFETPYGSATLRAWDALTLAAQG